MTITRSPHGHPMPGAVVADATALAAIGASDREDGDIRQLADGSRWRFVAGSSETAAAGYIVAPDAGTGRWKRLADTIENGVEIAFDHAQATATATVKIHKSNRAMIIDRVDYINPTGLAAHADNYFDVALKNGADVAANRNTKTGEGGALTADTFTALTAGTLAKRTVAADAVLSLVLTMTGTATLPAGRIVVHGHYV